MQIFDFINQDQIDELPDDDNAAFLEFVRIARNSLHQRINQLNPQEEVDWNLIEEAKHGFVNVVIATARRFKVEPFASMDVPKVNSLSNDKYRQFVADVDHYMTQILLDSRDRNRRETVALSNDAKTTIRTKLHHLRDALERSGADERTKTRLRVRLDEFEKDLERSRVNILAVARVAIEILAVPGALLGTYDASVKLMNQIMQIVGEQKITEDERRRLPSVDKPVALMPPRKDELDAKKNGDQFGGFSSDLDSDIPF